MSFNIGDHVRIIPIPSWMADYAIESRLFDDRFDEFDEFENNEIDVLLNL